MTVMSGGEERLCRHQNQGPVALGWRCRLGGSPRCVLLQFPSDAASTLVRRRAIGTCMGSFGCLRMRMVCAISCRFLAMVNRFPGFFRFSKFEGYTASRVHEGNARLDTPAALLKAPPGAPVLTYSKYSGAVNLKKEEYSERRVRDIIAQDSSSSGPSRLATMDLAFSTKAGRRLDRKLVVYLGSRD